jgi:hypothetical protein
MFLLGGGIRAVVTVVVMGILLVAAMLRSVSRIAWSYQPRRFGHGRIRDFF